MNRLPSRRALLPCASVLLACLAVALGAPRTANARTFTLPELIELAKRNSPSLAASVQGTAAVEAQLLEAKRSMWPSGELLSLLSPSPDIRCQPNEMFNAANPPFNRATGRAYTEKQWREDNCDSTPTSDPRFKFNGVFTRTEIRVTQPIYTFGKISAGINAASAGIEASRSRETATAAEIELLVKRAYYGLKLALQSKATLKEGLEYIDEAEKTIEKALEEGEGNVGITDRHRIRTMRAEAEVRQLEAERGERIAREGLRVLLGPDAPETIELADDELRPVDVPTRPLAYYQEAARMSRPEVRALAYFAEVKDELAKLEWRRQLPDLVVVGTATLAYAQGADNPRFAFANDPFNQQVAGLAAALRMPLEFGVRHARALRARAEAAEAVHRQREAYSMVSYDVAKSWSEMTEANQRMQVAGRGEKSAKAWIVAVAQNLELGLAEPKDFGDALLQFFNMRVRSLQAVHDFNVAASALTRAAGIEVTR